MLPKQCLQDSPLLLLPRPFPRNLLFLPPHPSVPHSSSLSKALSSVRFQLDLRFPGI